MSSNTIDTDVVFTKVQLEYLEKVFGENPGTPATTDAQLRFNSGVRTVIHHIRSKVRASK